MFHRVLGLGGLLVVIGCTPPPVTPNAGQPVAGTPAECDQACVHLRALGCHEGNPTLGEDGKPGTGDESSCEQTCKDVESSGYTSINPRCVETITSCAGLGACGWSAE